MLKYSCAVIVFPGGYGTLDEAFEIANLLRTKIIKDFPLVSIGSKFWDDIEDCVVEEMLEFQTINAKEASIFFHCEDPKAAVNYILEQLQYSKSRGQTSF